MDSSRGLEHQQQQESLGPGTNRTSQLGLLAGAWESKGADEPPFMLDHAPIPPAAKAETAGIAVRITPAPTRSESETSPPQTGFASL